MQFSGRSTYMSHSKGASSSHSRTSIAASSNDTATWNGKSRLISRRTPMRDVLISLQQPGNAHDRARKLPSVVLANALHARLPNRLILKINERESLSVG